MSRLFVVSFLAIHAYWPALVALATGARRGEILALRGAQTLIST
jgi:integrase